MPFFLFPIVSIVSALRFLVETELCLVETELCLMETEFLILFPDICPLFAINLTKTQITF